MKTPEETKKVLECCYGNKERRLCEKCPSACKVEGYSELICTDFDSSGENALALIQQLERERDEALEFNKELVETNNNLFAETVEMQNEISALRKELKQVKRERDAAVECIDKLKVILKKYPQAATNGRTYEAYIEIQRFLEAIRIINEVE